MQLDDCDSFAWNLIEHIKVLLRELLECAISSGHRHQLLLLEPHGLLHITIEVWGCLELLQHLRFAYLSLILCGQEGILTCTLTTRLAEVKVCRRYHQLIVF